MTGPVTALGIRDGDPDVLRALIARRGSAVLAYCERACPPAQVADAAAEAFARFRALVVAAPRPADLDPEGALLSSTRHAAAERAPRGQAPPSGAGLGRLLGGRPTTDQITLVPELLIARADGTLDADGEEQLTRLLDASAAARAAEERFRTAEHAYRSAPPRPIPEDVVDHIVAAMSAVPAPPRAGEPVAVPAGAAGAAAVADVPQPPPAAAHVPREPMGDEQPARDEAAAPPPGEPEPPIAEADAAAEPADEAAPAPDEPAEAAAPPADDPAPDVALDVEEPEPDEPEPEPEPDEPEPEPEPDEPEPEPDEPPAAAHDIEEEDVMADAGTQEWSAPPEEPGQEEALDVEIAAARLREHEDDDEAEAERIQTASGAVDEPLAAATAPRSSRPAAAAPRGRRASPQPPPREPRAKGGGVPGKGALAPAAAVLAVAAVSILATSGVLGGDESSPPVDTGVAPTRSQVEVPEGEAAAVIDELRRAADAARRQRLADQRGVAPPPPPPEEEEEAPAPPPAAEPEAEAEPAPDEEAPEEEVPEEDAAAPEPEATP